MKKTTDGLYLFGFILIFLAWIYALVFGFGNIFGWTFAFIGNIIIIVGMWKENRKTHSMFMLFLAGLTFYTWPLWVAGLRIWKGKENNEVTSKTE